jgi:hypothetical protein
MNIIKTSIVNTENDVFWQDISELTANMQPRPVLILVRRSTVDTGMQLQKMLEACKLQPEQYNIIYLNEGQQTGWHQLNGRLDPFVVFLIGLLPAQLGVSALFRLNLPNRFQDTIWLPSLPLEELDQRPEVKKELWSQGMKPVFVDQKFGPLVCVSKL